MPQGLGSAPAIGNLSKAWHRNGTELGVAAPLGPTSPTRVTVEFHQAHSTAASGTLPAARSIPVAPADGKPARSKTRALDASPLASSATSPEASD